MRAGASEGRLQLATKIARDHGACLSAVFLQNGHATGSRPRFAAPWLGLVTGPPTSGAIVTSQISEPADIAEQQFRDCLRSLKVEGDWYPLSRADTGELITLAQAADLVIIGQVKPDARPAPTWRPEEIVVCCGRPVLMVPYVGSYTHVGRRVLVAWDSSREAVRALNDALPLIHGADEVTLITVRARAKDLEPGGMSTERVVRHLARHGIAARAVQAPPLGLRHIRRATVEISRSRRRFDRCGSLPSFPATRDFPRWRQPRSVSAHDPSRADVALTKLGQMP